MTINEKLLKHKCETSFEFFVRYIFMEYYGFKFKVQPFHSKLFKVFEDIYDGKHTRIIINIPPRHSKTELGKMFIAWIIAKNPKAKSLILSYSADLAHKNSGETRDYVLCDAFQKLWDIPLKSDSKGKINWTTEESGEVYSAASGGQVTGFGAGIDGAGCKGGIILIDDPLKPDDAQHEKMRQGVNDRFVGTIKSRRNDTGVPIVLIAQRIHEEDLSGFLLDGNDGEEWEHVKIPVWDENKQVIWPGRYSQAEAEISARSQPQWFAGQMLQEPAPLEGGLWKKAWFEDNQVKLADVPQGIKWELFVDGAYTKDTANDPTGMLIAGMYRDNRRVRQMYVIHNVHKHLEMPQLIKYIKKLVAKWSVSMVRVEPKATGITLVQLLRAEGINSAQIKSKWVAKSKLEKAHDSAPFIESGRVKLIEPKKDSWLPHYLHEVATFPNGKHDEAIDTTSYAVERLLMKKQVKVY